ncbi:hypothetical protein PF005_g897 [Phytophthora fragariae]|uniref:Uncharacterized protein n=1 Tax=Phytophthora fragariae TaxID=53985 RepID=A0A6A3UVV6_9STRA|nr:hypothetical protein PF010_g753 [Phytophthora fragariae]KAE9155379.1 hypothetical protein PF006_g666 [Phytophthora fragariae]KAE9236790.1 hypothetical protein PF005_g897 [Phytophthora fragariae]KAE9257713.1 hypothetical protein PF002_g805 [Phytophthora fragariae]
MTAVTASIWASAASISTSGARLVLAGEDHQLLRVVHGVDPARVNGDEHKRFTSPTASPTRTEG